MLVVRCKQCNKEISSTNKTQCCGCPNMMTVTGDNVSAVDLNKVVMLNSKKDTKQKGVLLCSRSFDCVGGLEIRKIGRVVDRVGLENQ